MTVEQFVARFGEPFGYIFNGTYFDTGVAAKMHCGCCNRNIRYCFIVKRKPELSPAKITIGSCCFGFFQGDSKTYNALVDAQGVIQHRAEAVESETRFHTRRADVKTRMQQWREIRHKALSQIRQYRRTSGKEWLPESLFDLSITAAKEPPTYKRTGRSIRWFEEQAKVLAEQIEKISV